MYVFFLSIRVCVNLLVCTVADCSGYKLFYTFEHFFQCTYINGSPQNTFVPGALELAKRQKTFVGGDDFKSGQTKLKSVLVDFLVSAGIKPVSIVSYNHLGNNDGYNLSAPQQFRSKEVYDMYILIFSNFITQQYCTYQCVYSNVMCTHPYIYENFIKINS